MEGRIFRGGGAAKHVGAARVGGVGAVVNELAIEDLLLLEQQRHGEVFLVPCLHAQAQFSVQYVTVAFVD